MGDMRALYQEAMNCFAAGRLEEAVAAYRKVNEAAPEFPLAYQGLAEVYARLDRLDDAIATIERAIELDPAESLFQTSLSRFLQRQGKIPEAEAAAAEAARLAAQAGP